MLGGRSRLPKPSVVGNDDQKLCSVSDHPAAQIGVSRLETDDRAEFAPAGRKYRILVSGHDALPEPGQLFKSSEDVTNEFIRDVFSKKDQMNLLVPF